MDDQDQAKNDIWDPFHAQNILMPCDNATKLIRACYVGNWKNAGDILDEVEQELSKNSGLHKTELNIYPSPVHTSVIHGLGSNDDDPEKIPCEANGLRGLKGAERLAAWKAIEERNEFDDNQLHPKSLSAGDQVLSPRSSNS
jgi:hypothetical protein